MIGPMMIATTGQLLPRPMKIPGVRFPRRVRTSWRYVRVSSSSSSYRHLNCFMANGPGFYLRSHTLRGNARISSFPRSAWERKSWPLCGPPRSRVRDISVRPSLVQVCTAERCGVRSHAERGNERIFRGTALLSRLGIEPSIAMTAQESRPTLCDTRRLRRAVLLSISTATHH